MSDLGFDLGSLADKLTANGIESDIIMGVVTAASASSYTVTLRGDTTAVAGIKSLVHCKVGDTVWILKKNTFLLIVGRIETVGLGNLIVFNVATTLAGGTPPQGTQFLWQGGTNVSSGGSPYTVTFPTAFPNGLVSVSAMFGDSPGFSAFYIDQPAVTGFRFNSGAGVQHRIDWTAVGW